MKKIVCGAVLSVVVFLTIFIVMIIIHMDRGAVEDEFGSFSDPAFPAVCFELLNQKTENITGYKDIEDSIANTNMLLPIKNDRQISVIISGYDVLPGSVYISLSNGDGDRLLDKTEVETKHSDGMIKANYSLSALTQNNTPYYLTVIVSDRNIGEICYTTWVASYDDEYWTNKYSLLDFATQISDAALSADKDFLANYVSYDANLSGTDLSYVNNYSGNTLMCWGALAPEAKDRRLFIYEWSEDQVGLYLSYRAVSTSQDTKNSFNVRECFTVRERSEKLYLLDYERTASEIFAGDEGDIGNTSILLGIQNRDDIDCIYTDYGVNTYFVVDGGVWFYNYNKNTLINVFSFGEYSTASRVDRDKYNVELLGVHSQKLYFKVTGYQGAGRHEGEIGLCVYAYSPEKNETTESFYVRLHGKNDDCIDRNGIISYINDAGLLYVNVGSAIYTMDLTGTEPVRARENVDDEMLYVSEDKDIAAWKSLKYNKIYILDMKNDSLREVNGSRELSLAGFVRDDVVYLEKSPVKKELYGFMLGEYYSTLQVVEEDTTLKAQYQKEDVLIRGATLTNEGIIIKRSDALDFSDMVNDVLSIAGQTANEGVVSIKIATSEIKRNYYYINLGRTISQKVKFVTTHANQNSTVPSTVETDEISTTTGKYSAYIRSERVLVTDDLSEAISAVYDSFGIIYLSDHLDKPVWSRGSKAAYLTMKLPKMSWTEPGNESILDSMSAQERAIDILIYSALNAGVIAREDAQNPERDSCETISEELKLTLGDRLVMLSKPDITAALWYVAMEHPVVALNGDEAFIITGYGQDTIMIYDPLTRQTSSYTTAEAQSMLGNEAVLVSFR